MPVLHNLNKLEGQTLKQHCKKGYIFFKSEDKDGTVIIWGREDFIAEAYRQLNNTVHYIRSRKDPSKL